MYRQHHPDDPGMHHNANSHTRVRYRDNLTFWQRIKSSLVGIIGGVVLLSAAAGLLFWNEGRAVQTAKSLAEGLDKVLPLKNIEVVFEENNHKLVHLTGPLKTSEVLYDTQYGLSLKVVKLRRKVEMFQWVETEHTREINEGSQTRTETTYSYSTEWRSDLIQSSSFSNSNGHHNPTEFKIEPQTYTAENVQVGNIYLSKGLIDRIGNFKQFNMDHPFKEHMAKFQLHKGMVYHGNNPLQPEVGDLQVSFEYAGVSGKANAQIGPPDQVSVIAKQIGNMLEPFQAEAGDELEFLYMGELTAEQIFGKEKVQNTFLTWSLRFSGWLIMFVGFGCLTRIFTVLVDWIPLVRDLVTLGVVTMNMTFSVSLSLTVIALGWIRYRPWLGFSILFMALMPFVIAKLRSRSRSRERMRTNRSLYD